MPDYDYQSDIRSFSQVIEELGRKDNPWLYLGELVDAFGERGFGALMLFFGLLNIAIGIIPGTTTILGAPLLLMGLQLGGAIGNVIDRINQGYVTDFVKLGIPGIYYIPNFNVADNAIIAPDGRVGRRDGHYRR